MSAKSDIVAIVDDDRVFQKITWMKITRKNYARKVLMFSDGDQAMRFLEENLANVGELPDLILLDLNMPVMDGWDFMDAFARIKGRITKHIAIFVATSSVNPEDQRRATDVAVVTDYVIKPLSDAQLSRLFTESSDPDGSTMPGMRAETSA